MSAPRPPGTGSTHPLPFEKLSPDAFDTDLRRRFFRLPGEDRLNQKSYLNRRLVTTDKDTPEAALLPVLVLSSPDRPGDRAGGPLGLDEERPADLRPPLPP